MTLNFHVNFVSFGQSQGSEFPPLSSLHAKAKLTACWLDLNCIFHFHFLLNRSFKTSVIWLSVFWTWPSAACACVCLDACVCLLKLTQLMSCINIWADPRYLFVQEQHLNVQDNACTEATQLCVHTHPRSIATGSSYSKHSVRSPETLYNRKTVAAPHQGNVRLPTVFRLTSFLISPTFLYKLVLVVGSFSLTRHNQCVVTRVCQHWLLCCIM